MEMSQLIVLRTEAAVRRLHGGVWHSKRRKFLRSQTWVDEREAVGRDTEMGESGAHSLACLHPRGPGSDLQG